tara:strand:- start:54 stop:710 length:657 start_codon:yes stop_codon:yes gene_type:complete
MSSEIKVTNIKHSSSGSNNLVLASDGTTSVSGALTASGGIANSGTIDAGNISDAVTQPATDYIRGRVQNAWSFSGYEMLNLSGTTDPYVSWAGSLASFGDGGGSTVTGTTAHDFKFKTKGLYHIAWSCTFATTSDSETRGFYAVIRGNGATSEATTELAWAYDQVNNTTSATDYGNCAVFYTAVFNANDLINFQVYPISSALVHDSSHINIFKIRSLA